MQLVTMQLRWIKLVASCVAHQLGVVASVVRPDTRRPKQAKTSAERQHACGRNTSVGPCLGAHSYSRLGSLDIRAAC